MRTLVLNAQVIFASKSFHLRQNLSVSIPVYVINSSQKKLFGLYVSADCNTQEVYNDDIQLI